MFNTHHILIYILVGIVTFFLTQMFSNNDLNKENQVSLLVEVGKMELPKSTIQALKTLGRTLPSHSHIEICTREKDERNVCHRFTVTEGVVHHSGSHSADFVKHASGKLA